MKMNIVSTVSGYTGYSIHARNCANALMDAGVDLGIQTQGKAGIADKRLLQACSKFHKGAPTEMIMFAENWRFKLADRLKLIGFMVFEGDKLPLTWTMACNEPEIQEIWCPSEHVKDAIKNSEVDKHVEIIPHGFDDGVYRPEKRKGDGDFRFLYVGGWSRGIHDRKNVSALVRAFKDEFKRDDKAELNLIINPSYGGLNPTQVLHGMKLDPKGGRINLSYDILPTETLAAIYQTNDVFVCTSRAEAFNMPVIEAMGCGEFIITTNFGGMTDFVPKWNTVIGGKLVPAMEFTNEMYYEKAKWLEVDAVKLRKSLRWCFDNQSKVKSAGEKNAKCAHEKWKWSDVADKIIKRVNKLI